MNKRQSILTIVGVVLLVLLTRQLATRCDGNDRPPYQRLEGFTFHTVYHITYQGTADWHDSIRTLFAEDTPTEEPTATPTEEPTATPTEEPTATPTEEPTAKIGRAHV